VSFPNTPPGQGGAKDAPFPEQQVRRCAIVGSCLRTAEHRRAATLEERDMGVFNGMFPIQAGKEEEARAFAAETVGARLAGFGAHHARVGNTRETFTLQETPMGSFLLVWFEGDVQKAFVDLATDDSDFMKWFRGRVLDLTGVDLAAPPAGPPPEVLFDWHA
jgi:hypothetical protein